MMKYFSKLEKILFGVIFIGIMIMIIKWDIMSFVWDNENVALVISFG